MNCDQPVRPYGCVEEKPNIPNKMLNSVSIYQVDNGYTINVGCKAFVFESKDKMLAYVIAYINNPSALNDKFMKGLMKFDGSDEDLCLMVSNEQEKAQPK